MGRSFSPVTDFIVEYPFVAIIVAENKGGKKSNRGRGSKGGKRRKGRKAGPKKSKTGATTLLFMCTVDVP